MNLAAISGYLAGSMLNPLVWLTVLATMFATRRLAWWWQLIASLVSVSAIALAFQAEARPFVFGIVGASVWFAIFVFGARLLRTARG